MRSDVVVLLSLAAGGLTKGLGSALGKGLGRALSHNIQDSIQSNPVGKSDVQDNSTPMGQADPSAQNPGNSPELPGQQSMSTNNAELTSMPQGYNEPQGGPGGYQSPTAQHGPRRRKHRHRRHRKGASRSAGGSGKNSIMKYGDTAAPHAAAPAIQRRKELQRRSSDPPKFVWNPEPPKYVWKPESMPPPAPQEKVTVQDVEHGLGKMFDTLSKGQPKTNRPLKGRSVDISDEDILLDLYTRDLEALDGDEDAFAFYARNIWADEMLDEDW